MNIINNIIINLILVIFPILVYLIYNCYIELKCEKYNNILLNITLFLSLYLCIKYGNNNNRLIMILILNIPILLSYLMNQYKMGIFLSIIVLIYLYIYYHYSVMILLIKYICYIILYIINKKKNINENKFIIYLSIIQDFFISFEYFYYIDKNNIRNIFELIFIMLIVYIIPFLVLFLFKISNNITNLYKVVSNIEKEKQIKESLFKITHEVKNPIAVCHGYLEMIDINNKVLTNKYINIIKQEIDRSLNIMNDYMELSKIKITKEILDINILLDDIVDSLKILINSKNIKIEYLSNDEERYIEADYNRLKQVLINILKNSIEAIESKGYIKVSSYEDKEYYIISIYDNGIGIPKDNLKYIKDIFYTTKKNGTGLGIALSNEIIKSHNGLLEYISEENKYTKVLIKLPKYIL